jgi:NAD(P)-dependent dehydrogenase (short-subunit alcohol dehydrogenase family)
MRMQQKVSIITGAQSGIGLATARRFAAEGATVVLAAVKDASPAARELVGTGAQARFVHTDVSNAS